MTAGRCAAEEKADKAAKPKKEKPKTMTVPPANMDPDAFRKSVEDKGGRVDFIFEDDRPFKECHASTVVEAPDGSLLSAWFGGKKESNPDVAIWLSRFADGKWSAPEKAAKVREEAHWNPVLFRDAKGMLYLFFKVGVDVPHWQTYWSHSTDGVTWSEPVELVPGDVGGRGPVKDKPIILADGAWLAPASTELDKWKPSKDMNDVGWRPFADRSEDGGATWQRTDDFLIDRETIHGIGAIQPTFWESKPGRVHALMRTGGGCIARTDSTDGGRTWSPVYPTDLPNNNSGIDAVKLEDGRLLLVYNPISRNWGDRTPLYLAVSKDDGKSWTNLAALETEPGEYSYPAIVRTKNGVAVTYTWRRERVRCWQIPLEAL